MRYWRQWKPTRLQAETTGKSGDFCNCVKLINSINPINEKTTTVFAPISPPGAFKIEVQHCQFMLQLAPPLTIKSIWLFNLFFNFLLFLGKNIS